MVPLLANALNTIVLQYKNVVDIPPTVRDQVASVPAYMIKKDLHTRVQKEIDDIQ